MSGHDLDSVDSRLLNLVQREFPLTRQPYADLGRRLDLSGGEVIQRLARLKTEGLVRMIGPVMDSSRLGYASTLAAMKIKATGVDKAARALAAHAGVSHAYLREHAYNIWFTLAVRAEADLRAELDSIARACGGSDILSLPAVKVFKLRTYFDMEGQFPTIQGPDEMAGEPPGKSSLTRAEKLVVNEIQQDLPLDPSPFARMASQIGSGEVEFLSVCTSLMQKGIIRRFGAALDHNRAGYRVNALTCWHALPEEAGAAGRRLAAFPEVSHCYQRKTNGKWRYNLYAMLHSRDAEGCRAAIERLSAASGLDDFITLTTVRELKKGRIKYWA